MVNVVLKWQKGLGHKETRKGNSEITVILTGVISLEAYLKKEEKVCHYFKMRFDGRENTAKWNAICIRKASTFYPAKVETLLIRTYRCLRKAAQVSSVGRLP